MFIEIDENIIGRVCNCALKAAGISVLGDVNAIVTSIEKSLQREKKKVAKKVEKEKGK